MPELKSVLEYNVVHCFANFIAGMGHIFDRALWLLMLMLVLNQIAAGPLNQNSAHMKDICNRPYCLDDGLRRRMGNVCMYGLCGDIIY